ncbi:MAG: 3-oxoacyl-[acyl-carrier-protein] synthase III C-terminal domain-containing protein, partial [Eubacteriales bacterium]
RGEEGVISAFLGSDGKGGKHLECPALPLKNAFTNNNDSEIKESYLSMNGREIFKFAVKIIVESVNKVFEASGMLLDEIKFIVPHQANIRIIDSAAKKLGISSERFYVNLDKYGNTSGASIPIALDEMAKGGLLNKGDKIILVGFGAGLTYGAELIKWTK